MILTAYCCTKFTQSHTNKTFEWFIFEIFRDIYDDLISNGLLQELAVDIQNSDSVILIERTDHNGVRRSKPIVVVHPLALEAIHSKSNHHRYP